VDETPAVNPRPVARRRLAVLLCLVAGCAGADEKFDFKSHFFLKHLVGEWTTEGDLKGADGNIVKLKEEWKAEVVGEDTFVIEGKRQLNDSSENYKWTITRNPTTGLFEAAHRASENSPDTQRFEINFSEAEMKMEWNGFLGSGNARAILIDTFPEKDRDTFEGQVTLTDDSGATTLSGTLKNIRVKKAGS
jgi:hypothetical protein